jgi:hypothetical protein
MKWILILTAFNLANPKDVPAWAQIKFETRQQCELGLGGMTSWVKFESYKIIGKCEEIK